MFCSKVAACNRLSTQHATDISQDLAWGETGHVKASPLLKLRIKSLKKKVRKIIDKPDKRYGDKTRGEIADIKRVEINKINAKIKESYKKVSAYIDKHYDKSIAKMKKRELEKELE